MPLPHFPSTVRRAVADVSVSIDASPDDVFDYLADPRNRPEWQASLRAIADLMPLGDHPGDEGTSWTDVTVVPGVRPRMEVVRSARPRRWVEIGQWRFVDAALVLTIERASNGSTTVSARAVLTLPLVLAAAFVPLAVVVPHAVLADLRAAANAIPEHRDKQLDAHGS
ncbi:MULTISPECIES: SRPBCC family protein [Gordonia]|uniref:SRPBCC family protein n=1 Tax=Gordonia TaxID=2053 RepID=UPI00257D5D29|nr:MULTISPECIES: SRPBCC family protein [Gordonia]